MVFWGTGRIGFQDSVGGLDFAVPYNAANRCRGAPLSHSFVWVFGSKSSHFLLFSKLYPIKKSIIANNAIQSSQIESSPSRVLKLSRNIINTQITKIKNMERIFQPKSICFWIFSLSPPSKLFIKERYNKGYLIFRYPQTDQESPPEIQKTIVGFDSRDIKTQ